jgi:hypothetical protein
VFAIWLPMLAGDSRGRWDRDVLDDPRVVSLWDGDRIAGRWFGDHPIGGLGSPGGVVWDAYYAFGKASHWSAEPTGVVAAGSDIIDNVSGLEQRFLPLLGSS